MNQRPMNQKMNSQKVKIKSIKSRANSGLAKMFSASCRIASLHTLFASLARKYKNKILVFYSLRSAIKHFRFGLLGLLLVLAIALAGTATNAQESQIIGTVSVGLETPLTLELSSRSSIFVGQHFNLKAELNNIGQNDVDEIILSLDLSAGLDLIRGDSSQDIGTVKAGKKAIISWRIRGSELGNYVMQVQAIGIEQDTDEQVEALTSQTIEVRQKKLFDSLFLSFSNLFRFLFRF